MKSILSKLSPEEIKELSKAINKQQKKNFGNPLSLRKQEQMMADLFEVKNWSTLIGSSPEKSVYDPNGQYQRTVVQIEILSNGAFPTEYNLDDIHHAISDGDCSGAYTELSRESISAQEMAKKLEAQGSDPSFLITDEGYENNQKDKDKIYNYLRVLVYELHEDVWMDGTKQELAAKFEEVFEQVRKESISKYNRLNDDKDLDSMSEIDKILCEDKVYFTEAELIRRISKEP